jgi:hypothetical protein
VKAGRLLLAALLALGGAAPAMAQPEPVDTTVRVDVKAMSAALVPDETTALVIRARAVNTGPEPLRRLSVALRFGPALRGRSAVAAGPVPERLGQRTAEQPVGAGELAVGATADTNFDVPLDRLPFRRSDAPGVYPLRIEVRARFRVVGAADTYVMWWPQHSPKVRLAWVWPLVEQSHRAIGRDFYDDDLATSVRDGRLSDLLHVGATSHLPLTWAVDPELLDALHRMTGPYTVRGDKGTSAEAARSFLDRAKGALRGATVLPLPYADPDLAAVAEGAVAPDAARSFQLGREILRRELGTPGNARLAWPPGATLDPGVESLLSAQGVKGVVVPYGALPLSEPQYFTPTAPAPLAVGALGSMTALVSDQQLDGLVAADSRREGPRLAAQRFIADAAMIALERPTDERAVVVTPPRTWDPVVGDYPTHFLARTAEAPWIEAVGLDKVLAGAPSSLARTRTPAGPHVLPADQLRRVLDERRSLQRLRGILTDPEKAPAELADLDDALLRSVSATWGTDPGAGHRLANSVDAETRRQTDRLRVLVGGTVTMTGRSGKIPVTFQNDLGQPVRIRVRLDSNHRLALSDPTYESARGQEVPVPPGSSTLIIHGKATTGGLFPIKVELLGSDGKPLAGRTTLQVRSTAYGAVALVVTGVAFGLLLIGSATRLVGRRRRARRAPADPAAPEPVPV